MIGDDTPQMLLMDTAFTIMDSIKLHDSAGPRINWQVKPDYEDIASWTTQKNNYFFIPGSGSGGVHRNTALLINADTKEKQVFSMQSFYKRLQHAGIKDINVEGAAALPGTMLLSNRGNKGYPKNFLIFTDNKFWQNPDSCNFNIALAGISTDTASFNGISGLQYSSRSDKLFLTVSTEDTYSNHADGAIGKSYLWIVNDITAKRKFSAINPNTIIDLNAADKRFAGHKIEAVAILNESSKNITLVMVSDDDDGKSILFKVRLQK